MGIKEDRVIAELLHVFRCPKCGEDAEWKETTFAMGDRNGWCTCKCGQQFECVLPQYFTKDSSATEALFALGLPFTVRHNPLNTPDTTFVDIADAVTGQKPTLHEAVTEAMVEEYATPDGENTGDLLLRRIRPALKEKLEAAKEKK